MTLPFVKPGKRRGSAYLAVLGASMVITIMGLSALMVARVQFRTSSQLTDVDEARSLAQSGIELTRLWIASDPNWRKTRPNGAWATALSLGRGTIDVQVTDPNDNIISNWPDDPVTIVVSAYRGAARQIRSIMLKTDRTPLDALSVAVQSGGAFRINSGTLVSNQTIAGNGSFTTSGTCLIDANIESASSINGSRYLAARVSNGPPRTMPNSSLFDFYVANATTISFGSTGGTLDGVLLSPDRNPYGLQKNPLGIYVIDCGGNTLQLKNSRIVGTLVLLNPRSDSKIVDSVNLAPAVPGFPALLVQGSCNFEIKRDALAETSGRNFNPIGTPYNGVEDTDTVDTYPSLIQGLVYVSGNLNVRESLLIQGCLMVGGTVDSTGTMTVNYDPSSHMNPPPGFTINLLMKPVPGSWKSVVK